MDADPQPMSVQEVRDSGLLQEINRRMLHPLGFALGATMVAGARGEGRVVIDETKPLQMFDLRESYPHGRHFGDGELALNACLVDELEKERRPERERVLGFWVEPVEEEESEG